MTGIYGRLLDGVESYVTEDGLLLAQGNRALRIRGGGARLREMVDGLRAGLLVGDLIERHGPAAERLIAEVTAQRWLTGERPAEPEEETGWARQLGYLGAFGPDPQAQQRRLRDARVAVVGVGGIGALLAQHLAAAGVGALWLVDHDDVAVHNLNRQYVFAHQDVGTAKVVAAATALRRLAPGVEVRPIRRRVTTIDDLDPLPHDLDLLVVAADEPADLMETVWPWAEEHAVPVTRAAVGLETGWWGPIASVRHGSCWRHFERDRLGRLRPEERRWEASASTPLRWSFGPSNSVIAGMLAHDAVRFLAVGESATAGRRAVLDFARMAVTMTGDATCTTGPDHTCALKDRGRAG